MALSNVIRTLRRKAGLSQQALGARLGVDKSAVAHWEGGGGIALSRMPDLAAALDIELDALLAQGPERRELVDQTDELAVLAAWRRIAAADRPAILRLLLGHGRSGPSLPASDDIERKA